MIIQSANIVSGFVLGAPALKRIAGLHEHVHRLHAKAEQHKATIGIIELVIAVLAFLDRIDLIDVLLIGTSFPQIIAGFLVGGLLAYPWYAKRNPTAAEFMNRFRPYEEAIGVGALVIGIFGIL